MALLAEIPGIGPITAASGCIALTSCSDGRFAVGRDGVVSITATGDRKVEFIAFESRTLAYVKSAMGYPAYYPVHPVRVDRPVRAVLMDLDGTSVRSENFWVWIIQLSIASLLGNPRFELEEADLPYVSGHSVSEHLQYCIGKYCPDKSVEEARGYYFEHTAREMKAVLDGRGKEGAFTPTPGLKEFLLALKSAHVRIGLVTSGLYEKAWPEILSAFRSLELGDPATFYDAAITAGFPLRRGSAGMRRRPCASIKNSSGFIRKWLRRAPISALYSFRLAASMKPSPSIGRRSSRYLITAPSASTWRLPATRKAPSRRRLTS